MGEPVSSAAISRKVVHNTLFNFFGRSWAVAVGLLLTPYIVSVLGVQRFGVWSLLLAVTQYFGVLDLGVSTSFVKFIAEYDARGDVVAISSVVSTGFAFYLAFAALLLALVLALAGPLLNLFDIPASLWAEARLVLIAAVGVFAFNNAFGAFQAVMTGLQRMEIINGIVVVGSIVDAITTVVLLRLGYGLTGLVISRIVVFCLTAALLVVAAFRILPGLRVTPRLISWSRLRVLLDYGVKVQVTQLTQLVSSQADKLLLGYFVGLDAVSFYELGARIVLSAKRLSRVLISAVLPAASEIDARQDMKTLYALYRRGARYLALVTIPLFTLIAFTAPVIVRAWVGEGYERSIAVMQVLAIGHGVHLLTGMGTMVVKGMGKPEYETRYTALTLVLNLVLGIALIGWLGFTGVLIATPIALVIGSGYFFWLFHRLLKIPLAEFLRRVYGPPLQGGLLAGLMVWLGLLAGQRWVHLQGRGMHLGALGLASAAFVLIYAVWIWQRAYLDSYDRQVIHIALDLVSLRRWLSSRA